MSDADLFAVRPAAPPAQLRSVGPYLARTSDGYKATRLYLSKNHNGFATKLAEAQHYATKDDAFRAIAAISVSFRFVVEDVVTQQVFA